MSEEITHTIYLIRHGQCKANLTGETLPPEDDLITEVGKKQADALGDHLKYVEFTKAFASTYQRSYETAKRILSKSKNPCPKTLRIDADIREREMTGTIGLPVKEINLMRMEGKLVGKKFSEMEIPGCESQYEFTTRIRRFFTELFDTLKKSKEPETVLIVSHGLTMKRFLTGIKETGIFSDLCLSPHWELHAEKLNQKIPNTAATVFTLNYSTSEGKFIVEFSQVFNTNHLNK